MSESSTYWDALASRWDALLGDARAFPNHGESARRFHWFLKRKVKIGNRTKTYRLLDLACGTGEASWPLWKRVASVTFFDRSPAMLKAVRHKYEKGIFVCGDASATPFLDEEFDVILSRGALISQMEAGCAGTFLKESWRTLRPHGLFLFDFIADAETWPGDASIFRQTWTRDSMECLIRATLPGASIEAWDGAELQATGRVLLRK